MMHCLGIDTSCYTTSVALCSLHDRHAEGFFNFFDQRRKLLTVAAGERGLRQSEALFQHVSRLPALLESLLADNADARIALVCASVRPRPDVDSYMPVFRAGEAFGRSVAAALRVPFMETTHQQGHMRAALVDTALCPADPLVGLHLSGGTTEVLHAANGSISLLGGTKDLHAGQLIDRIGVALGLPFPAGPHLEKLAMQGNAESRLKVCVDGTQCHLSGAEAQALRWIASEELPRETIAAEVFSLVARTVVRLILSGCQTAGVTNALLFGGVASSKLIGQDIKARLEKRNRAISLQIARADMAGDNAVGVALLGADGYEHSPQ